MRELMERIHYQFQDEQLLHNALSHSSYVNEGRNRGRSSNERLEFLGDSVLSIIVSEYIYTHYKKLPEGDLTKVRASVVCEKSLAEFSRSIDLGRFLLLGRGEEQQNGRERDSILADAFEAMLAAVYLDGGFEAVRGVLMPFIVPAVAAAVEGRVFSDYKTELQEIVQKNKQETLHYELVSSHGPDHDKVFEVAVYLNSNRFATGVGKSKKEAEQQAAKKALELMGES